VPTGLDWNAWLNQAAERPYHSSWMTWMSWRDFGGGQITNWGAHGLDQLQWALGADATGPVSLAPLADGPAGAVAMRYADGVEVKMVLDKGPMGGAVFVGEKGKLEINRNKIASNPPEIAAGILAQIDAAAEEKEWSDETALWQARAHLQNWLDCIRSRERPVADVEIGHRSATVCHLNVIAAQVGRSVRWDPKTEEITGDPIAARLLDRPRRAGYAL
jgi:predicted dehydrogenase